MKSEGQISCYPTRERKRNQIFFIIEYFECSGINYCYTIRIVSTNYMEAISSDDSE